MNKILLSLFLSVLQIICFAQSNDAELVNQNTSIVINKDKLTKDVFYQIKINNRAGEKFTKITIPFSKLHKVSNIDAYIEDSNGKTVKISRKATL